MKKSYAVIKRFHQTYEVEIAVLAVAAVYMSMLLAGFFWFFQLKNADLKDIAACRMWDRKVSIQAVILFFIIAIILGLVFCFVLFLIKQKHIQGDKIIAVRKKTGNFFRTYIKELEIAYMLSVPQATLFIHFVRGQFLEAETEIMDLVTYKQLVFDYHLKMFCVCNIALLLLIFPNFAYVVKIRRNENIIKILREMKKHGEKTKSKIKEVFMTKKRLTRDLKWGFQYFPYYQMRIECDRFCGWAALNELTDGEYLYWDFFEKAGRVPVAGKGMCWLTLIPDGKKHSVTTMFTEDESVSAWYIDVIHSVIIDEDGVLAFMDKYLDVMLTTSGDILVDDKNELEAAYQSGEFTKDQYEAALLEGQRIIDEWGKDIHTTELICKEMLHYVKEQVNNQPFTVFLDVDGVLNIYQPDLEVQTLLPYAKENICELIHRMKAKVVVISSHRSGGINWDKLLEFFKCNNIYDVDITPYGEEYHNRTEEINAYLHMHPNIKRYVILDDCFQDDYSSDSKLREHLVFVDALKGLQKQDIIKACEILNRPIQAW